MLHGNTTGRTQVDGEFDANSSLAYFATSVSDGCAVAAIFGPGFLEQK